MFTYILNFSACLALLMTFYKLLLETASIHHFKRYYLLCALIISMIIPSLTFVTYIDPIIIDIEDLETVPLIETIETVPQLLVLDYLPLVLWGIYGVGVFVFLLKFCFNLYRIISRIQNNPKYKSEHCINVLVSHLNIPHTFLNYIFLNKIKYEQNGIPKEVLLHEQTHAKQKHSLDILLIEIVHIILWFNPLIYFLKKYIKLNHEFLADHAVLTSGIRPENYQNLLLAFSSKAANQQLANAINYSSIKKRFTIMKTQTPKRSIWLRTLLLIPLLAILFYSFTQREDIEKEQTKDSDISQVSSEGISPKLMTEYTAFITTFKATNTVEASQHERAVSIYNMMSEVQKASVEKYPKIPNIDISKIKGKTPSEQEFESWKNANKYALWLDGKAISNSHLNNLSVNDIAYYTGSFVHENARTKAFPQVYQLNLYTAKGFKNSYQLSKLKDYNRLTKQYSDHIKTYLNGNQTDNSELRLLKTQIDRIYRSFTQEDIEQHNILPAPPVPAQKSPKQATKEQIAEYNKLATYYNDNLDSKHITIRMKDVKRLKYLYGIMTDAQRKNAEPFPDFPKPPPPPEPVQISSLKNSDIVTTHKNTSKDIKTGFIKINNALHYFTTIDGVTRYFNKKGFEVSKTGQILSASQINASDVIPNQYITKVYSKDILVVEFKDNLPHLKREVIIPPPPPPTTVEEAPLPPPPPPPLTPIDFVVEMAKNNAIFYYEGNKVSSDKAIELVKKNKDLNIEAKDSFTKQPKVYITKEPITIKN